MTITLDQTIAAAQAAEQAYNNDVAAVATIQAAIVTASAPLAAAQAQLATDTAAFVTALQAVSAASLAEVTVLAPPATTT